MDRAERRTRAGLRPDDAEVIPLHEGRLVTAWPTKWALAPRLAASVLEATEAITESEKGSMKGSEKGSSKSGDLPASFETLRRPGIAAFPWEERSWTSHHDVVSAEPV